MPPFELLKERIKTHPQIAASFLSFAEKWRTSHYNELSNIINENLQKNPHLQGERKFELGNTISSITLKRFFEGSFSENATNDLRFIKTLDKLCIFLGYESFNQFISEQKSAETHQKTPNDFERIIFRTAELEFNFIKNLPKIEIESITEVVHADSPYYHRIEKYLSEMQVQGLKISDRPSNFEIYNIDRESENETMAVFSTHEFWNLNFLNESGAPYHYHMLNKQSYFFKKIDDVWKIWDNHNPNVWELIDKI